MNTPSKSIRAARIIGFFSMPSPSMSEHNPEAYMRLISALPEGAGVCSQCGMGIMHHVTIIDENGVRRHVGQDCAAKVGADATQIKNRLTDEQRAEREAKRAAWNAEAKRLEAEREAIRAERAERFADIIAILNAKGSDFHASLASQLLDGPLSWKQAAYAVKATSETGRRNKKNAAAWDAIEQAIQN